MRPATAVRVPCFLLCCLLACPAAVAAPAAPGAPGAAGNEVRFGVIGMGGGALGALKAHEEELGVRLTPLPPAAFRETPPPDLSAFDVLLVSFATGDLKDAYRQAVADGRRKNPDLRVFCVGPPEICAQWADWLGEENVRFDPQMAGYYGLSRQSMKDLLRYTLATYFGRPGQVDPPGSGPVVRIYHPDYGELETVDDLLRRAAGDGWDVEKSPRVALGTWRHHCLFHQPRVVKALIDELKARGILAVCLIADDPGFQERMTAFSPDLVIMTSHTREPVAFWERLGVPRIHALWFTEESIDAWEKSGNTGMSRSSMQHQIGSAERSGATECLAAGGTRSGGNSGEEIEPVPDRIRRIGGRARAWIDLAQKGNAEKRVALVVYDREADKAGLLSGPAHNLNAPRSLVRLLRAMKDAGYGIDPVPAGEDELLAWMVDHGRQMGAWEPGPLDRLARSGKAVLLPEEPYRAWFEEKVPPEQRAEVIQAWGPPPGKLMVWENGGKRFLVLPRIDLGNVALVTQPPKGETLTATTGEGASDENLLPPTHHYLATYFWLQEGFRADALVHFGTHGSEWLFPGKMAAISRADWSDMMLGDMPNVNPWLSSNTEELNPCKRRARAVTVDFMPPPLMDAGLSDDLLNLESTLTKYFTLEPGALQAEFARSITGQVYACRLDRDLDLPPRSEAPLDETGIRRVSLYLHDLKNEMVPSSMHVLGEPPPEELRVPYLAYCMGKRYRDASAELFEAPADPEAREDFLRGKAEEVLALTLRQGFTPEDAVRACGGKTGGGPLPPAVTEGLQMAREMNEGLDGAPQELKAVLAALDGAYVPPGPSGAPERNPGVLPTGRNMFVLNPEELPSRSSWEVGTRLIREYLERQKAATGRTPRKVAFSLVPFATYNDFGVIESQILYLMGVRPVWDAKNRVRDVELIPAAELGRPRIDVFLSARSVYRDELPGMMKLLDKAVRLAASAEEEDNHVRQNSLRTREKLLAGGMPEERAEVLARARMFGAEPNEVLDSHNWFFYLTERSGEWEDREDLLDVYLRYCKHAYTDGAWGEQAPEAFDQAIQDTELILRSWYDGRDFVLANKFAWWVDGTLSLAVKHITGKEPAYLFVDVRDMDDAGIVDSAEVVDRDLRVRLMNPGWIQGMMKEGYAGGNLIAKNVDNLMGWEIMRGESIPDSAWEDVTDVYLRDGRDLRIREWFEASNPHAFQKLTVTLLETIRKGFWPADAGTAREIAEAYARSVVRHGKAGGIREGGNEALEQFVEQTLAGARTPETDALLERFRQRSRETDTPPGAQQAPAEEPVAGKKLARSAEEAQTGGAMTRSSVLLGAVVLAAALIVLVGFRKRSAVPRGRNKQ